MELRTVVVVSAKLDALINETMLTNPRRSELTDTKVVTANG